MRRTIVLIATVVAIGSLLAGCDGDGDSDAEGAADQTASFPAGRYETTADVDRYEVITFNGSGSLSVEYSLGDAQRAGNGGSYVVDGRQVTIRDHWCSQKGSETAHYAWTWDGSLLKMTPVGEDPCADRRVALAEMRLLEPFGLVDDFPMIRDPAGDSASSAPGYLDTVAYGVSETGDDLTFAFEVAGPIPEAFKVPMGYDAVQWSFCLDTDPSSAPAGYPFVAMEQVPCEFILTAVSEGGPVAGTLIDRRPLANGKEAETSAIPVTIDGARGVFAVPAGLLGYPDSFGWAMTASVIALPLPSDDFVDLDANYEAMNQYPG